MSDCQRPLIWKSDTPIWFFIRKLLTLRQYYKYLVAQRHFRVSAFQTDASVRYVNFSAGRELNITATLQFFEITAESDDPKVYDCKLWSGEESLNCNMQKCDFQIS